MRAQNLARFIAAAACLLVLAIPFDNAASATNDSDAECRLSYDKPSLWRIENSNKTTI